MKDPTDSEVLVIGAGPAGLAAAHRLLSHGIRPVVLEADPTYVGGLARTVVYKGNRFDVGGHRFFTRSARVQEFWTEILGEEMLSRPRRSRIIYRGVYLNYPLELQDTFEKLGYRFLVSAVASWCWAQIFGPRDDRNFEEWIVRRFGRRIFTAFFKSYTEKVWGIPCSEISADWAAQRINQLSIPVLLMGILRRKSAPIVKTLINEFEYPRLGPGQLWERVEGEIRAAEGEVQLDSRVVEIVQTSHGYEIQTLSQAGVASYFKTDCVISTMPLRELTQVLYPLPPAEVLHAAASLRYRDFIAVALVLDCPSPFSDQWLYVHEPKVQVGRVQNMENWSKDLVADERTTVLLFEYFCTDTSGEPQQQVIDSPAKSKQDLWSLSDEAILTLAQEELETLQLAPGARLLDSTVLRAPKAYPLYDAEYKTHLATIRNYLASAHPGLQTIGRNGMHRYNNQDHAILTGFIAADALAGVETTECAWSINQDAQHIEERLYPESIPISES